MKIKSVTFNNRKHVFEIDTRKGTFSFPYSKSDPNPKRGDYVEHVFVDKELGNEAFTYILGSGKEGTVHLDHILEFNQEPEFMKELFSYKLSVALNRCLKESPLGKRELARRLSTSPSQLYRLLEPTHKNKSLSQILTIFALLDLDLELKIKDKKGKEIEKLESKTHSFA